ncbi:MAG: WXG100 family type VII secretion target [Clostridia bacterium]|nr:WXG100 family type VII secretion target [Clostridia bacterium]
MDKSFLPAANVIGTFTREASVKVDTNAVRTAVDTLSSINKDIDNSFSSVQNAMNKLNSTWDGAAAAKANSKLNTIKKNFVGTGGGRYQVMEQYIKFLANAVALDYETTEDTNTKLSEMFK